MTSSECIPALKALADENRMRLVRLLSGEPMNVNAISETLMITQYNASKHLRILREAGLLQCDRQGRQRHYSVPTALRHRFVLSSPELDLGCCSFRLDHMPR